MACWRNLKPAAEATNDTKWLWRENLTQERLLEVKRWEVKEGG